jgi:hypothetical protein
MPNAPTALRQNSRLSNFFIEVSTYFSETKSQKPAISGPLRRRGRELMAARASAARRLAG